MSGETQDDQTIRTLDRWTDRLLRIPNTIECPVMQILGRDFEPPLFTGSGHIQIDSRTQMHFVTHATPRAGEEAFKRFVQARNAPYNVLDQFRVLATEYNGTEWNGGWTTLHVGQPNENAWRLSGALNALSTGVSGPWVARESSIEVVFDAKLRLPTPMNMVICYLRG